VTTGAARLTWPQVMAWRVGRHHLGTRAPRSALLEVTVSLGGLHAQLMSSAELTAWARVDQLEPDAVATALWEHRSLVKTWAMRGTLHLLPSSEYGLWQSGLASYRHFLKPAWSKAFGLSPGDLDRMIAAISDALDGRRLTREELAAEVVRLTGDEALGAKMTHSFGTTLKPAAFRGRLCFGPNRGRNITFARPDQWIGEFTCVDPDVAMTELLRRFLATNGPATRAEVARWWAITPATATRHRRRLGDEVADVDVEGTPAWMLTADVDLAVAAEPGGTVNLLPAFDQYVIASTKEAANLLPGPFRDRVYRPQGWISPVLLVDGRMDGVWRHERKGARLAVTIEPFVDIAPRVRKAAEAEATALGRFLGTEVEVTWA
jgi:hypothetical protein